MPTANRLDKETNRLDGGYMSNYREEVDVDRRLMIFYQHHNSCNDKYQNAVAIRRLVEDQKTKALLDKYKETSRKDNVSLAQDKTSKPKVTIKSEQQQSTSDPPRSQKDSAADSSKVTIIINVRKCTHYRALVINLTRLDLGKGNFFLTHSRLQHINRQNPQDLLFLEIFYHISCVKIVLIVV